MFRPQVGVTLLNAAVLRPIVRQTDAAGFFQAPGGEIAGRDISYFPCLHKTAERFQCLLDRRVTIIYVGVVKIECLHAQAF